MHNNNIPTYKLVSQGKLILLCYVKMYLLFFLTYLPIHFLQILTNGVGHHIRALIVLPVQELATQVAKVFKKYTARTSLKVALLSGSIPLRQEQKQIIRYSK